MTIPEPLLEAARRPLDEAARQRRRDLAPILASWALAADMPPGLDPEEELALDKLAGAGAPLLVSGQQAALAGGPALVLWKALALVSAADALEVSTGDRPLTVFWIEGNDHDWSEAATPGWPLSGWSAPCPQGMEERSVGRVPLDESWWSRQSASLDRLAEGGSETWQACLRRAWQGDTLARHLAGLLRTLLPGSGLLFLDPSLPAVRELAEPFAVLAQQREKDLIRALLEDTDRLRAAGRPAPVKVDQRPPWFAETDGRRRRAAPGEGVAAAEFSPNALTRILLQDWLLSPAAALLGPTEEAYHAQAACALQVMKLPAVPRMARPHLQLTRRQDRDAWARHGMDPWAPPQTGQAWPEDLLLDLPDGPATRAALKRLQAAVDELLGLCAGGRQDLEQLARRQQALGEQMRQAMLGALKAQHRDELKRLHSLAAWQDAPAGAQERRVNALALLGRMGGAPVLQNLRGLLRPFEPGQQRFICDPETGAVESV